MSKAQTLATTVSTGNVLADGTVAYAEVSGTPTLATVATSGAYADVTGTPTLATVATSGSYTDLTDKPTISATATNIAGGSAGTIPYQSATDTTAMLAVGTAGQVLQTNGAGAPTWVDAAGGGSWTKLSSASAYLSNIVDFTGFVTSEYNTYAVVLYAFSVQSGGSYAAFRFFVGGTIQTSGYTGSGFYTDASGTFVWRGGSDGTSTELVQLTNAANTDQAGVIFINANNFNNATGTSVPSVNSQLGGGPFNTNFYQSGSLNTTSPITGIRFYAVGGTLAGYFDLYGIKR